MHRFDTSVPHFITRVRDIVVTQNIVSEVLHVPRVAHLDYPSCDHLRIVSKDKLSSLFCETPSSWGDCRNTPCSGFAKGPRFLNMVMTFILHSSAITWLLCHFSVSYPDSPYFTFMYAIDAATVRRSIAQLRPR